MAALGLFGTVQWRSAVDAKREVDDLLMVDRLVTASRDALDEDPELALLLSMQSLRPTVDLGYATEEAVDAVHFALQEMGVQYDVDAGTPVAARPGSQGPVGVYALPPSELMAPAESAARRTLTDRECQEFLSSTCPAEVDVPDDLALRGGSDVLRRDPTWPAGGNDRDDLPRQQDLDLNPGFAHELRRSRSAQASTSSSPPRTRSRPELRIRRTRPTGRTFFFGNEIPAWAELPGDRHRPLRRPRDPASDFGEYLLGSGTLDSAGRVPGRRRGVRAIPGSIDLKGLVFYPKAEFEKAGYEVPSTWAELIELSDRIVADGRTPWCFGFDVGRLDGWPGTDLSRVWYFGSAASKSDAWTPGEIGFSGPAVMEAGRMPTTWSSSPDTYEAVRRPSAMRAGTTNSTRCSLVTV